MCLSGRSQGTWGRGGTAFPLVEDTDLALYLQKWKRVFIKVVYQPSPDSFLPKGSESCQGLQLRREQGDLVSRLGLGGVAP